MKEVQCSECNENMVEQHNGYLCPRCGQLDQYEEVINEGCSIQRMARRRQRGTVRLSRAAGQDVRGRKGGRRERSQSNSGFILGENKKNQGGQSSWKC